MATTVSSKYRNDHIYAQSRRFGLALTRRLPFIRIAVVPVPVTRLLAFSTSVTPPLPIHMMMTMTTILSTRPRSVLIRARIRLRRVFFIRRLVKPPWSVVDTTNFETDASQTVPLSILAYLERQVRTFRLLPAQALIIYDGFVPRYTRAVARTSPKT